MPTATQSYGRLLADALPEVIEDDARHDTIRERFSDLVRKGANRTGSETKLMKLLGLLIEDYDGRNALPSDDSTPGERLHFLLEIGEAVQGES
jgi:hypothetical protein